MVATRRPLVIAIDGPAGAGKSSAAKVLARRLDLPFLDTGAIYRAVALVARERGVPYTDPDGLGLLAHGLPIRFVPDGAGGNRVLLDGRDVTAAIREPEVSQGASRVSAIPAVRAALLDVQRRVAAERGVVAEGRDVGTVVFPDAIAKFFVTASVDVRARRRVRDLLAAGVSGADAEIGRVRREIEERDERDRTRDVAPLRQAEDAVYVDTSDLTLEEVVALMERAVRERAFPLTEEHA